MLTHTCCDVDLFLWRNKEGGQFATQSNQWELTQKNDELASFLHLRFTEYLHFFLINGDSRGVKSKGFMVSTFSNQK